MFCNKRCKGLKKLQKLAFGGKNVKNLLAKIIKIFSISVAR